MGSTKYYDIGGRQVTTQEIRRAVDERRALLVGNRDTWTVSLAIYDASGEAAIAYDQHEVAAWPTVREAFRVSAVASVPLTGH